MMKHGKRNYLHVEELHAHFQERKDLIRSRIHEFSRVRPDQYYYELAYCLLTPQSSAVNAGKAVEALTALDYFAKDFDASPILADRRHYIRFHNTKAKNLCEAKMRFPEISAALANGGTGEEIRAWLTEHVHGLGWKEASHFLRNIGYRNLAILDRHILKNLKRHKVLRSIPRTLTPGRYAAIERKFAAFAETVGITMDELDLLFWSNETGIILK